MSFKSYEERMRELVLKSSPPVTAIGAFNGGMPHLDAVVKAKYIKRTGTSGNYKYLYAVPSKDKKHDQGLRGGKVYQSPEKLDSRGKLMTAMAKLMDSVTNRKKHGGGESENFEYGNRKVSKLDEYTAQDDFTERYGEEAGKMPEGWTAELDPWGTPQIRTNDDYIRDVNYTDPPLPGSAQDYESLAERSRESYNKEYPQSAESLQSVADSDSRRAEMNAQQREHRAKRKKQGAPYSEDEIDTWKDNYEEPPDDYDEYAD